ncbi:hypothetical protein GCM10009798_01630 [Nocardioides panacihumi]|uniref:Polysaccharide biosynthesis protein C-terminal domain-containing protein n=1 Tax=Nocardioides panacihumi TaxID=400774 RepID=A0ABN2Q7I5_9ACTN
MSGSRTIVARAAAVGLVGGVIGATTNLVLAVLVGHALGAAGAGPFFQVMAVVAIASNVLELGADTGLVRQVSAALALGRGDHVCGLVRIAAVPVGIAVTAAVAAGALAAPRLEDLAGGGRGWVVTVAAASGLTALLGVLLGAVRAMSSAVAVTLVQNVALPLARLGLVALCVATGSWRPVAVAWLAPLPAALLVAALLLVRAERRHRGPRPTAAPTPAERREFWAFSAPRGVGAAAEICLEWADVLIVGALCSPAAAGVYAVVTRAARSAELVQQASRLAVGPVISAALAQGRLAAVRRLHHDVALGTALLSWPFFVIAAYFAPALLGLFGPDFTAGATALRILCLGLALSYAAGGVQSILLMGGRSRAQLGNKVACLVVNVGLNLALDPRFGIVGAATAWAVVLVLDTAMAWLQILVGMRLRLALRPAYVAGTGVAVATTGLCLVADTWAGPVVAMFAAAVAVLVLGAAATTAALRTSVPPYRRRRPSSRSEARRIGDVGKAL